MDPCVGSVALPERSLVEESHSLKLRSSGPKLIPHLIQQGVKFADVHGVLQNVDIYSVTS